MNALLKEIEIPEFEDVLMRHPIKMLFVESEESEEIYRFGTTIETQFCNKGEFDLKEGMPDKLVEEKVNYAKSLIGKAFEINLYKFTVKELTDNKYEAFEFTTYLYDDCDFDTVEDYHIASYMTKEDVILNLKYSITRQGIDGVVEGVLPNKSTEEITTELFFPKPIPEKKHFSMPYDKYPNINSSYIINEIPVKDISKGRNLAYQIEAREIKEYEFDNYVHEIEKYRSKVREAKLENESFRKKLFFWEPKVMVEELKLSSNVLSLMKDCIILGKEYPSDCEKVDREYAEECEKRLRKQFMGKDSDEKEFKDKFLEFRQTLRKKYKSKDVIKPIN